MKRLAIIIVLIHFLLSVSYGAENNQKNIKLTPADQLILNKIDSLARDINARFEKIETKFDTRFEKIETKFDARFEKIETKFDARFDSLWATMLGGFIGVMAFIGGMVFWDRRTFLKQAKKEFREEIDGDKKKIDAILMAMKKLAPQFPEVREALKSFGLL